MAPAKEENKQQQQFDFETMVVVLYAIMESGVTLGSKHYEIMANLDGTRGKDAFNHQFRKVKARAKELQEMVQQGELCEGKATPVKAKTTVKGGAKGADSKGTKRARKARSEMETMDGSEDEGVAAKKMKEEPVDEGEAGDTEGVDETFQ